MIWKKYNNNAHFAKIKIFTFCEVNDMNGEHYLK